MPGVVINGSPFTPAPASPSADDRETAKEAVPSEPTAGKKRPEKAKNKPHPGDSTTGGR